MRKLAIPSVFSVLLIGAFLVFSGFSFPDSEEAVVKIDGKVIEPEGTIRLEKDDTIYLEVEGVKPHSIVDIKVKKLGVSWVKDTYTVDETGGVKAILNVPEKKLSVMCFVSYYTARGTFKQVKFKFKVV